MVEIGSKPGDLVFDPFAGGGTTGAACVEVGSRRAILVEQSDLYSTAIEKRLGIKRGDL
jgi:DNA modification methylase